MFKIPRWVLEKTSYGEGRRLKPLVPFKKKWNTVYAKPEKPKDGLTNIASAKHELVLKDPLLDFQNWEYRFWCPENDGDMVCGATCRQCSAVFIGDRKARFNHNKSVGCYNRLVKAYEVMLKDKNCVMCDAHTTNSDFGVPLCKNGTCKDEWMHNTATPKSLDSALRIVIRKEKEAKAAWEAEKAEAAKQREKNGHQGRETQVN